MNNYFDVSNDKSILPPEVQNADNLDEVAKLASDSIDLELENRGWKSKIDGWDDDADNVSDDKLVRAVKWSIAYKISDVVFQNTDQRIEARQIGPKRVRFDQGAKRDEMKFIRPFVDEETIWSLS